MIGCAIDANLMLESLISLCGDIDVLGAERDLMPNAVFTWQEPVVSRASLVEMWEAPTHLAPPRLRHICPRKCNRPVEIGGTELIARSEQIRALSRYDGHVEGN